MLDLEKTLSDLIAIPSVNPMGQPVSGPEYGERGVTDCLETLFDRFGLPWERQAVAPGRDNIFARLEGTVSPQKGGQLILFEAHQDTVQVDGMTIPPWSPVVREGRIYGRGACDTKGSIAAMLGAVARLAEERPKGMPTIVMACSANEEFGAGGAAAFADFWDSEAQSIFPRPPDAAIFGEPTNLNVVVAHKGTVRWRCRTRGRAAHSSQPQLGDNAIYKMAPVLEALEDYQKRVCPTLPSHPLCGRPTVNVGLINGGQGINTVPDECAIIIERRVTPSEDLEVAREAVINHIENVTGAVLEVEHEAPLTTGSPLSEESNGPLSESLLCRANKVRPGREKTAMSGGSNAGMIAPLGIPCVLFGPGSIDQAHTRDEWLPLDELREASEILYQFGKTGLLQVP